MTDDNNIELTRRKILGAAGTVGIAGAGAGLGTSALFYDEESFLNNSITAGEVDMAVEAEVVAANDEYVNADSTPAEEDLIGLDATADGEAVVGELTFPDFKNGDWIIVCWTISIVDNPVCLTVTPQNVENFENNINDAEADAGDTTSETGELGEYLEGSFWGTWDDSGSGVEGTGQSGLDNNVAGPVSVNNLGQVGPLDIPTTYTVYTLFELPMPEEGEDDNDAQGDTVEFDLVFRGEQSRNNDCEVPDDGGEECPDCSFDASGVSQSSEVTVTGTNTGGFPDVSTFLQIDTTDGMEGNLSDEDFALCENGCGQSPSVSFDEGREADIVFVFDETGSMDDEADEIQSALSDFISNLNGASIDARFALVRFGDSTNILEQDFTSDATTIDDAVGNIDTGGGGDLPEDNFDSIGVATRDLSADTGGMLSPYRSGAQKVIIDITDAVSKVNDLTGSEVENNLIDGGFTYIAISPFFGTEEDPTYSTNIDKRILANNVGGTWIDINTDSDLGTLLTDEVSGELTSTWSVSYTTTKSSEDGTTRDIVIEIDDSSGTLYATTSYTAPGGS